MITQKSSFITCTPLIEMNYHNCTLGFKMEQENFLGSIKSRTAYYLIQDILNNHNDNKPLKICESTSGNLGLALNHLSLAEGIECLCLIDPSISQNKLQKLQSHGVNYEIVTAEDPAKYRQARINRAMDLNSNGYIWTNQYDNPASIKAHYETTGPEIYHQTYGKVTHLICAMGTGGTIIGVGRYLHEQNPNIKIIGVEPWGSTIFSAHDGNYLCAGAGMKGKPGNIAHNPDVIDDHYAVQDSESIKCCNYLYKNKGLSVGITSGMAFSIAQAIAQTNPGSYIVVICPDGRNSYEEFFNTL